MQPPFAAQLFNKEHGWLAGSSLSPLHELFDVK
jgi:hypothetical protein